MNTSDDEDMGAFLRFPEREGSGWNLPNTKNALTPSELRQRTQRPVVADGGRPLFLLSHGMARRCHGKKGGTTMKTRPFRREEFFYFSIFIIMTKE
ncbi:hypothetical protein GT50_05085 [Geobacillus stearothermophilus 10]|nr:hypothetical protein GT50_05085 [Geobacillus stearothermophilus 10]